MNNESMVHLPSVLSVFDGMSCGQAALGRAGITYDNYFSSEIDKHAIKIATKNYPETIHLGTIVNWREWSLPKIDLLIGGSPCQGFSNAGLGLNFDDPRSKLFFTYVDILNDLREKNPELLFLLENVKMKKEWRNIITKFMGVEPVEINSALVSAQNRKRLYWTNIPNIEQPEDRHIYLKDIIENGEVDREKSYTVDANYFKGGNPRSNFEDGKRQLVFGAAIRNQVTKRGVEEQLNVRKDEKSNCVVPSYPHRLNGIVFVGGLEKGRRLHDGKNFSKNFREGSRIYSISGKFPSLSAQPKGGEGGQTGLIRVGTASDINGHDYNKRVYSLDGKSPSLAGKSGGNLEPKIAIVPEATKRGFAEIHPNEGVDLSFPNSATPRGRRMEDKCNALQAGKQDLNWYNGFDYRKLTVIECERLQTLPDNYTEGVSNTQRYKMIGNGWTIEVIAHIFRNIKVAKPLDT